MGLFKQCKQCGNKGLFLKLIDGLCKTCNDIKLKEIEQEKKQKECENNLLNKKDELHKEIAKNGHNVKDVIQEYKEVLNELNTLQIAEEHNIQIFIDEINEKEAYILTINEMQHLIWELNNPQYCLASDLVEDVEKLEQIYLPKIKEMEQKNIKATETKSWQIENFIEEQKKKTSNRLKREEKKIQDKYDYIVFDIETTGLSPVTNEITEIGALKVKNGEVIDTFEMLVKPTKKIPKKIIDLTGITNEMVADAPPIEEVLPKFMEFIEKLPVVAHNAKFDYGFINENHKRIYGKEFRRKKYCTMEMYRKWHKETYDEKADSAKLGSAVDELLTIEESIDYIKNAHRALNDAEFTYRIYQEMV